MIQRRERLESIAQATSSLRKMPATIPFLASKSTDGEPILGGRILIGVERFEHVSATLLRPRVIQGPIKGRLEQEGLSLGEPFGCGSSFSTNDKSISRQ